MHLVLDGVMNAFLVINTVYKVWEPLIYTIVSCYTSTNSLLVFSMKNNIQPDSFQKWQLWRQSQWPKAERNNGGHCKSFKNVSILWILQVHCLLEKTEHSTTACYKWVKWHFSQWTWWSTMRIQLDLSLIHI